MQLLLNETQNAEPSMFKGQLPDIKRTAAEQQCGCICGSFKVGLFHLLFHPLVPHLHGIVPCCSCCAYGGYTASVELLQLLVLCYGHCFGLHPATLHGVFHHSSILLRAGGALTHRHAPA